jgi:hypothetical protein
MWKLLDSEEGSGFTRSTYATQVGAIGCLVMVETKTSTAAVAVSTVFVPSVTLVSVDGRHSLEAVDGFGRPPSPLSDDN